MQKISLVGANSFIGKHVLAAMSQEEIKVKALLRKPNIYSNDLAAQGVKFVEGDLLKQNSLYELIEPGDLVINLAYLWQGTREDNLSAIKNLAEVCVARKVKRLLHCSTAVVSGAVREDRIDEESPCSPVNDYQITKFAIEQLLLTYKSQFEVVILRPTAVFGPGGKNLLKLIHDLQYGSPIKNYLKSCVLGQRVMNLVCVHNVVAAILFLGAVADLEGKNIFLISDDEDSQNNYRDTESYLLTRLSPEYYSLPVFNFPDGVFTLLSAVLGKGLINPKQIYLTKNLSALGFKKPMKFQEGLEFFADWCIQGEIS